MGLIVAAITVPIGYAACHADLEKEYGQQEGRARAWRTGWILGVVIGLAVTITF